MEYFQEIATISDTFCLLVVFMAIAYRWSHIAGSSLGPCRITGYVGMPVLFTMIAKVCTTTWAFTFQLGTTSTACCYHSISVTKVEDNINVLRNIVNFILFTCVLEFWLFLKECTFDQFCVNRNDKFLPTIWSRTPSGIRLWYQDSA